jgi:GntR family transcriptional regulator
MCYSTRPVIAFRVQFRPGIPLYEQVVHAATKAMLTGRMLPGDPFPSVRTLSRELKINPNTAHKVITLLMNAGLLESRPGLGTVVASRPPASTAQRAELLGDDIEQIVVEARKLRIPLEDVQAAVAQHWRKLGGDSDRGGRGGR